LVVRPDVHEADPGFPALPRNRGSMKSLVSAMEPSRARRPLSGRHAIDPELRAA